MTANTSLPATTPNQPGGGTAHARRRDLVLMLLAAAALMTAWSFAVPVFEGPDEQAHWEYAHYVNHHHALPVESPNFPEAASPPLYYILISPIATKVELPPVGFLGKQYGVRTLQFPPRLYQNDSDDFSRFWFFRVARLVSVLMSVFTIWFCVLAGEEASGDPWTGLLAGGLLAFWPMFTFRAMNASNDALMTMLCSLAFYLIFRMVRRGFTWGVGISAAVVIAGAFLTKINAAVLPVAFFLALLSEKAPWRARLLRAAALGALMLAIVAPWLVRNLQLYGELLAQHAMYTMGTHPAHKLVYGWKYFQFFFPFHFTTSFIGVFGWMDVFMPGTVYLVYLIALFSAGACWVGGLRERRIDFRLSAILAGTVLLNLVAVIHTNTTVAQPQGRYMLPSLPALALLLALGLASRRSWSIFRTRLTLAGMAAINLVIVVFLVIPAYWPAVITR